MPPRPVPSWPRRNSSLGHVNMHAVPMLGVPCSTVRSAAMGRLLNLRYSCSLRRQNVRDFTGTVRAASVVHYKGE
jgi:hypothetical protein